MVESKEKPCPELPHCLDRRVADAVHRAKIETQMDGMRKSIEDGFRDTWGAINDSRRDIKFLYWRMGLISGGTALIVSLIISLAAKHLGG